jgi:iron complex outermembrane receptor protein
LKFSSGRFTSSVAVFNRDATNLIDYIRQNTEDAKFTATNIAKVNTKGFEINTDYRFKINELNQTLSFGYNYLNDDILEGNKELSRYSLNTLKHQFITRFTSKLFKHVRQNIIYKHAERSVGASYNVWDASIIVDLHKLSLTVTANNIFDADYIETGFVPMPPSNLLVGLRYHF